MSEKKTGIDHPTPTVSETGQPNGDYYSTDGESVDSDSHNNKSSEGSDNDSDTTDVSRRFWLTNDILAFMLVGSLVVNVWLHAVGWLDLQTVPNTFWYLYAACVATSVGWAFGKDVLEAYNGGKS